MNNEIKELFLKKKKKEDIKIENNLFSSFEECSFRSNTLQPNFNITKGRINQIEFNNHYDTNSSKNTNKNNDSDISKNLNPNKKGFKKIKDKNELNNELINKYKKIVNKNKEKEYTNLKNKINEKENFSNTCNSFFKRNVDNFINNYLKNKFFVNENINTLNYNMENNNYKLKNITVNKNGSLSNLTKSEINVKKYINVNRIEALKMKHNNFISRVKDMLNNKQELIKNNSFCKRYTVNNNILNPNKKKTVRKSINYNSNDCNYKSLNETIIIKNNNKKANITLRKRNYQNNNNYIHLKTSDEEKTNLKYINNQQKSSFRKNIPKNSIDLMNINSSERIIKDKNSNKQKNNKLNYMTTSPTLYNINETFYPFNKNYINSPFNENLSFSYKSLKGKINKLIRKENKYKTLNLDNNNEEIFKLNQIYTNTNSSNKKVNIFKKKSNSKERKNKSINEDKYNSFNKSPIIDNSFNYFSKITNKNDSTPYIISHIDITSNAISAERKKEKNIKKNFFEEIELNNKNSKIYKNQKINNNIIINENKNTNNILNNKNEKNKIEDVKSKSNRNKKCFKKPIKIVLQSKQTMKKEKNNLINDKNKTSCNFFNNKKDINYGPLKKIPKLLREKHFSDFDTSFLDKTQKLNTKLINSRIIYNKINNNNKTKKENKMKLNKKIHDNQFNSNNIKKPFFLTSARQNNYLSNNNVKNGKIQENIKQMKSFINSIEKIIDFCGSNRENHPKAKKYLETYNTAKSGDSSKNDKKKNSKFKKNCETFGNLNISKLKLRPIKKNCFIQKYYNYASKKEISKNCFISKLIYKKELELEQINMDKINGGISPFISNIINSSIENSKIQSKGDIINKSNSFINKYKKLNLNIKSNPHLKINKNNIKNQLNINTTSLLEYKDLNKKIKFNEQNENSILYNEEESEVTFGRKEQLMSNHKSISNQKTKYLKVYDLKNNENINYINNNTFCYYNNEFDNEYNNKDYAFDEESFVNGEINYFNNTFNPNNQKFNTNDGAEIKSITNNIFNNNNIILFSPKRKQIYFKYKEKAFIIVSNIILNHRIMVYEDLKKYFILQKNKNKKNEFVIYTKKRLKDNGGKLYETASTESSKNQYFFTEKEYNNDLLINNNEKSFFEKKKNNYIKKLKIRTRSSDFIIFDKNDKSVIKKIEINLKDINNKKYSHALNTSLNTPRNRQDEKNIISPHFIDNKKINIKMENINNNKHGIKNNNNIEKIIINLKNFDCTPKFFQNKPKYIEDIKFNNKNENKKKFTMEEILYIGSSNSYCYKENLLTNNFISHCEEMLKNVEILGMDELDKNKAYFRDIHNQNKYEILSLLNKITSLNYDIIFDKLNYLIIKDNNNQYIFIKLILNKVVKEKKYISLYADLCFNLYKNILKRVNNEVNDYNKFLNQNLGFDNDLKNILNNECKLKFNVFINEIKLNDIKSNIKDIKREIFYFFDFVLDLIKLKLLLFENIIFYLEILYKDYINNNNGNNISILYLELILYLLDRTIEKLRNIYNIKNRDIFKKLIEEKIIIFFEKSEFPLPEYHLKYKIMNLKDKLKIFIENNYSIESNTEKNLYSKEELYFFDKNTNEIINNIFINSKREENIKLLLFNDLQKYIKEKNEKMYNLDIVNNYNWIIIDELIFDIHLSISALISSFIEICKEKKIDDKNSEYEYFNIVLNYFIQYMSNNIYCNKEKVLDIFSKIWLKIEEYISNELFIEKLGYIFFLLLNKNLISINNINYFINENKKAKKIIIKVFHDALIFDKEKYNENIKILQKTKFFINNKNIFNMEKKLISIE